MYRLGFRGSFCGLICLLLVSCGVPFWETSNQYEGPRHYFSTMRTLQVEVAYEPGAEPFTGTGVEGRPVWDFLEENLSALFRKRPSPVTIMVPKELEQMRALPPLGKTTFRTEDIVDIADRERRKHSTDELGAFYVIFLNGYFQEGGVIKDTVLGVSLSGTSIIAIFKPVVQANMSLASSDTGFIAKYVEQSTLVHEMGHALGLVGNGVPTVHAHQDKAHGAHCTNHHCVMHWSHEASADLRDFVSHYNLTQNLVVFDDDCLLDVWSYQPQ